MSTREIAERIVTLSRCGPINQDGVAALVIDVLTERIDAALTKAIAGEREAKWQPIETAPRDGRSFFVAIEGRDLGGN